ncbi:hypothetical protein ABFS82_09G075600 [Erythranthe guttata]|nr:PREDICTED: uncharacterized protein LOC105976044 [Erythranthe guttata]XP_012856779.1 PREDICTED: uncharacterized protein LOC105976044 [Erythranthe guttata]|eukprot:XP_012856778.1 PREDICTED: uncharacterized protein LOC105976044 [Erythranthe guttata]
MAAANSQERNTSNADSPGSNMVETLKQLLVRYGTQLLKPCDSTEELLELLHNLHCVLIHTLHDHKDRVQLALQSSKEALIANELIRHTERDVRISVASCISEIVRITAPDEPYKEDQMKEYFGLLNTALENLSFMSGGAYLKAVSIVRSISLCQSCVLMLDHQLYDSIRQMFHLFFNVIRSSHHPAIFSNMVNIMAGIVRANDDNDEFSVKLAKILLARLKKEDQNVTPASFQLAEGTFKNCSSALKEHLPKAAKSLGIPIEDYAEVVASLLQGATQGEKNMDVERNEDATCQVEGGSAVTPPGLTVSDDVLIRRKRSRKPNSLLKPEEGYDPLWTLQGSQTREAPAKKGKRKTILSEDPIDAILNKRLPSQSTSTSSKGEALSGEVSNFQNKKKSTASDDKGSEVKGASSCVGEEVVGRRIKVFWPLDQIFYEGKITSFDHSNKTHQVVYDDGDHEKLDLSKECWLLIGDDGLSTQKIDANPGSSAEILTDHGTTSSRMSKGKEKEIWIEILD